MIIGSGLKAILDEIKTQRIKVYHILTFPLDAARQDFELYLTGNYLYVLGLTGSASIRLNELSADSIDLFKSRQIQSPFYRIYLSNTAQAGLSLVLGVGVQSEYFQISDYQAPDIALMTGYTLQIRDKIILMEGYEAQLRDSHAYNQGTQVAKSNAVNNGITLIHTVSTGKTFILEHYNCEADWIAINAAGQLQVTDAGDTNQYAIFSFYSEVTAGSFGSQSSLVLSIPEGWKIKISSNTTNLNMRAFIKGREV